MATSPDPQWFTALTWSTSLPVEALWSGGGHRNVAPASPGVYVFTLFDGPLTLSMKLGVLYVGKAKNLLTRTRSYLVDPANVATTGRTGQQSKSLNHAGKVNILVSIVGRSQGAGPSGVFFRWTVTPTVADAEHTEKLLTNYFQPAHNTYNL